MDGDAGTQQHVIDGDAFFRFPHSLEIDGQSLAASTSAAESQAMLRACTTPRRRVSKLHASPASSIYTYTSIPTWSKIAQHLPGRTDNEIKNYWRTRVQKHAKQLNCDANSKRFKDAMRYLWMPHLVDTDAHRARLLHATAAAAAHHHHSSSADLHAAALSAAAVLTSSSSADSFATAESYDDGAGAAGLYAGVHAGDMLVVDGAGAGDCWAAAAVQETSQGMWPSPPEDQQQQQHQSAAAARHQQLADGGHHHQFQDAELSGWVQGFSEGIITENFWALEDIWKIQ
ncbi:hypothetical protein BS78_08G106600 [Paspalum vaginatum]|nr:hypothetical protein BS78_08G106600 [Paspalum vaginatum]